LARPDIGPPLSTNVAIPAAQDRSTLTIGVAWLRGRLRRHIHSGSSRWPCSRRLTRSPFKSPLADEARRLRAAFDPRVPKDLVEEAAQRLAEPGALSATLNWYRAVDDDLQVPAGEVRVPTLYIWGENDMALGEDAAMRTRDFVKAPYKFVRLVGHAHWLPNDGEPDLQPLILAHLRAYD
jgi:pimeloyl-ACP methyl ester carboxylesterase